VFEVCYDDGRRAIAKVLDGSLVNAAEASTRVGVVAALADLDATVCRPIPLDGRLVTDLIVDDDFVGLLTAYEHADGVAMDTSNRDDAWRMGQVLAELHESMSCLPPADLPFVAALASADSPMADCQLLHGDFNAGNLRQLDGSIKVFDFDDCGYGPPAFDVANALYMVLFDSIVGQHSDLYESFRQAFVSGYTDGAGRSLDAVFMTELIDRRVDALALWIDDIPNAPIGIRTATREWHEVLRSFVGAYRSRRRG
jgi:Ser/Thr protein kinase RdoA (MazF antagonist)